MLNLPYYYYAPVFFEAADISFEFINPDFIRDLTLNAAFVSFVKSKQNDKRFYALEERIKEFEASDFFTAETNLNELGIKVIVPNDSILLTEEDCEYLQACWISTDRYFYPHGFRHIGSSRHGLLYTAQLKGIGRNNLAHRGDYVHAWGGFSLGQAITSMIGNLYIDEVTTLGSLPVWGIARLSKWIMPSDALSPCILYRDARAYRLAHFEPGSNRLDELSTRIKSHLEEFHGTSDRNLIRSEVLKHFMSYLENGVNPRSSVIPENLLFDGRAIDTEEYDIFVTSSPVVTLSVNFKDLMTKEEFLQLDSEQVYSLILKDNLPVNCENLTRIFHAWFMYSTILEELFTGHKIDVSTAEQDFIRALSNANFSPALKEFFVGFAREMKGSMALSLKTQRLNPEQKMLLHKMPLLKEVRRNTADGNLFIYITFARDHGTQNLNDIIGRVVSLTGVNKNTPAQSFDCMGNYLNLKSTINQLVRNASLRK